jgi:hypothetical protein
MVAEAVSIMEIAIIKIDIKDIFRLISIKAPQGAFIFGTCFRSADHPAALANLDYIHYLRHS